MSDLVFAPAYQLAQMIRDRVVSAVEVLDAHLNQIASHNFKINAICTLDEEHARQHARQGEAVEINGRKVPYIMASGAYTIPLSFTGHPVVIIPIGRTEDGLPIGMQIIGKRWREMELLAIAQELNNVIGDFQYPSDY